MLSLLKRSVGSQLRRNMASGILLTVANTVVSLAVFPVYLSYLGSEVYGLWLVLALVINFARFGMLGIPEAVAKLVAEEDGQGNPSGVEQCATTALGVLCAIGLLCMFSVIALRYQIVDILGLESAHAVVALRYLPMIAVLSLYVLAVETFVAVLSGLGRMDQANYSRSAGRLATAVAAVVLLVGGLGLKSLLIANAFGALVIHIVGFIYIRRRMKIRFMKLGNWNRQCVSRIFRFGASVSGMSLLGMLLSPFNKLILTRYVGLDAVPVYEISYRLATQMRLLFQTAFSALLPEISRESGKQTVQAYRRIQHLNRRSFQLILRYALPGYLLLAAVGAPLLNIWLGDQFVNTMPGVFRILLVGSFLCLLASPPFYTLLGTGQAVHCLLACVIQSIVNVGIVLGAIYTGRSLSVYTVAWALLGGMVLADLYLIVYSRLILANFFRFVKKSAAEAGLPRVLHP